MEKRRRKTDLHFFQTSHVHWCSAESVSLLLHRSDLFEDSEIGIIVRIEGARSDSGQIKGIDYGRISVRLYNENAFYQERGRESAL